MQQYACGVVIEPADAGALVRTLIRLATEPESVAEMGRRARKMLDAHFTRQKGLERWRELLGQLDQLQVSEGRDQAAIGPSSQSSRMERADLNDQPGEVERLRGLRRWKSRSQVPTPA